MTTFKVIQASISFNKELFVQVPEYLPVWTEQFTLSRIYAAGQSSDPNKSVRIGDLILLRDGWWLVCPDDDSFRAVTSDEFREYLMAEVPDRQNSPLLKPQHLCARRACRAELTGGRFYRIENNPCHCPSYRDYCIPCGRKIIEFNQSLPANELKLEFTIESDVPAEPTPVEV